MCCERYNSQILLAQEFARCMGSCHLKGAHKPLWFRRMPIAVQVEQIMGGVWVFAQCPT